MRSFTLSLFLSRAQTTGITAALALHVYTSSWLYFLFICVLILLSYKVNLRFTNPDYRFIWTTSPSLARVYWTCFVT
jgi:hypothetical protein